MITLRRRVQRGSTREIPGNGIGFKREAYELMRDGEFGNRLRQWETVEELLGSDFRGRVALRYRDGRGGGGRCEYHVPVWQARHRMRQWVAEGLEEGRIYFSEMAPDEKIVLQGELIPDGRWGWALFYSRLKKPMREALAAGPENYFGPGSLLLLQAAMGGRESGDWGDFSGQMERWPESAIEFSIYSVFLGNVPRRRVIVWEVRNY